MRLYRLVNGRKRYKAMCGQCGSYYNNLTAGGAVAQDKVQDQ